MVIFIIGVVCGLYLLFRYWKFIFIIPVYALFLVVLLPATPFLVAYRNRKEKPVISAVIVYLWSLAYLAVAVALCF